MSVSGTEMILAGPGTGKTTTLVNRVIELLNSEQAKNKGIILCTFTRKATEELTQRIYSKVSMGDINRVNFLIGTIHSICYELLTRYSTTDYSDYSILAEGEQIHFIHSKLKNLGYPTSRGWSTAEDLAAVFNKINDQEIDIQSLDLSQDEELQLACDAYGLYRRILNRFRLFDFASIQSTFLHELQSDQFFKERILTDFSFFFVDEYQDINPIQHKIFEELSSKEHNITVVGDDDQCIYEFRGSDVSIIRDYKANYAKESIPVKETVLNINYRSTSPIVNFTNNLLKLSEQGSLEKGITPFRSTDAHKPVVNYFADDTQEIDFIVGAIEELKKRAIIKNYNEIAVLYRSVKYHSAQLITAFKKKGIPFSLIGSGSFFDSELGEEFLGLLDFALAKDEEYKDRLYDTIARIDEEHFSDLTSLYAERSYVDKLDEVLNSNKYSSCIDLTYDILATCDFFERYADEGKNLGVLTSLVASFDEFATSYDPWNLFSFFTYLKKKQDVDYIDDNTSDGVQVMTIHQSKGLEFPVVFIPSQVERNDTSSIIDRLDSLAGIHFNKKDEEFRVLYVACTRAEDLLVISGAESIENRRKKYPKNKYIAKYLEKFQDYTNKIDYSLLGKQEFRERDRINTDNPILSYNAIALYRMCPRAYMYSHEWNLSTTRIGGMEFGQNVHKIIETILRKIMGGVALEDIDIRREVETAWKASSTRSLSSDEKFKKAALEQIETFVKNSKGLLTKDHIHSSEDLFNISVGGNLVTGRFDAVFTADNDYTIVDFKTGDPKNYAGQLSFYSVCFKEKYRVSRPVKLAIYYLKSGKYESVQGTNPDDEIASIVSIADKIRNKEYPAKPGKVCGDCAFNKICPYKK